MMNRGMIRNSKGLSLIEVLVATLLLSIILLSLAAMTSMVSRRSIVSTGIGHRNAAMTEQQGRLAVIPFHSLSAEAGCRTITDQPFPHQSCLTVTSISGREQHLQFVITPTNTLLRPDTLVFDRTRPTSTNPFNR